MSAAGFARVSMILSASSASTPAFSSQLDWNSFLDILSVLADDELKIRNPEQYVNKVAGIVGRLNMLTPRVRKALDDTPDVLLMGPVFNNLYETLTFQVISVILDKGQELPPHDHPEMTAVLACASGTLSVSSYERLVDNNHGCCLLQALGTKRLVSGYVSTLTDKRGNIHTLKAEQQSQISDIVTPVYDDDRKRRTNWYAIEAKPISSTKGDLFRAALM